MAIQETLSKGENCTIVSSQYSSESVIALQTGVSVQNKAVLLKSTACFDTQIVAKLCTL